MSNISTERWLEYDNPLMGISMKYPPNMDFEEDPVMGIIAFGEKAVLHSKEPNPLAPILNITVGKVAPGINTLDDLTNQQLERLNQMNANYKLDRDTVLGGYKAHKFILDIPADVWISTSPVHTLKIFSIWTIVRDHHITIAFTCLKNEFKKWSQTIQHMLTSVKLAPPRERTMVLDCYNNVGLGFSFRYPRGWKLLAVEEGGPLVRIEEYMKLNNKHYFVKIAGNYQEGVESLDGYIEGLRDNLNAMNVTEVEVEDVKLASVSGKIISWISAAATGEDTRYVQVVAKQPDSGKFLVLTTSTNNINDEIIVKQMDMVAHSLRFHSDEKATRASLSMSAIHHAVCQFEYPFSGDHWELREETVPFVVATFNVKGAKQNDNTTMVLMCRLFRETETVDLDAITEEVSRNIIQTFGPSMRVEDQKPSQINGRPARSIRMRGLIPDDPEQSTFSEVICALKVIYDEKRRVAVMVHYVAAPSIFGTYLPRMEECFENIEWL